MCLNIAATSGYWSRAMWANWYFQGVYPWECREKIRKKYVIF